VSEESGKLLVAVIDPSESYRRQVSQSLVASYRVVAFGDGDQALAHFAEQPPNILLVDNWTPPSGGAEMVRNLRKDHQLAGVPIILTDVAAEPQLSLLAVQCGADFHLTKPYRRRLLIQTISEHINRAVERRWESLPKLQQDSLTGTLSAFTEVGKLIKSDQPLAFTNVVQACTPLVEAVGNRQFKEILREVRNHDDYSYAHSVGTATLLLLFGYTIGLQEPDLSLLGSGGLLLDVGKMMIPSELLNKTGNLTLEELDLIKSHVELSIAYLEKSPDIPKNILTIAGEHHERLDGSGYPKGLKKGQLNELARMAAIVDVFCAMTERRAYRPSMSAERALAIMTEERAAQFDQKLLGLFREMLLDSVE
jgi:HD-GYP domain-containing protein (c-di-GMP phosphodiesterase class II)